MECPLKIFYHDDFLRHDPSPYSHPETPGRLVAALEGVGKLSCRPEFMKPSKRGLDLYERVHSREYLSLLQSLTRRGEVVFLDPDTYVSPGTLDAVERLAGAALEAVEVVARGEGPVVILGRPPGHHTGRDGIGLGAPTQGFCIVNTSALLAVLLADRGDVLVVDFDAHHGNGTQDILWEQPIPHVDVHQDYQTIYPGTGAPSDTGSGEGAGTKVNINLPPRAGDDIYSSILEIISEAIEYFKPDYIVVSAGFDAYHGDTAFVSLNASANTFYRIGDLLSPHAPRTAVMLEGGYSMGLRRGLPAFLAGLLGMENPIIEEETSSSSMQWEWARKRMLQLSESLSWIRPRH